MNIKTALLATVVIGEVLLGISPKADRTTWFLENLPVFILIPVILRVQPTWRLSTFTLCVLAVHAFILMTGGYYSYAEVPFGFWMQDAFGFARNHYDRIGHFMQGFGPAIALHEILKKRSVLKKGMLLNITVISMCVAFSAFYEMIEWWSALALGQGADAFLGTQGDPWDTQWDMFMALVGASSAILLTSVLPAEKTDPR